MPASVGFLVIDAVDPQQLARFWCGMLGVEVVQVVAEGQFLVLSATADGLTISFQAVPEAKSGKNRLHLDLAVTDLDVATAEAESLGGRWLEPDKTRDLGGYRWRVMADPEGNEFDIALLPGGLMPTLLVVHHTPSPAMAEMFEAAVAGARTDEVEDVDVVVRPALAAGAVDVLGADGYLLGTPANIGYMSGALKHFFDQIYYPCLEATRRRPCGLYVHGGLDTGGAVRAVESIITGLQWKAVRPAVAVTGAPGKAELEACWELGALLAAEIAG